jgi:hypothetical protein
MVWTAEPPADIDSYEPLSFTTLPLPALKTIRGRSAHFRVFFGLSRSRLTCAQLVAFQSISTRHGTKLSLRANLQRKALK